MDQIILEPELAQNTLNAWGQTWSLIFQFRLYRPPLGYYSLRYKNAFDERSLIFVI